MAPWIGAVCPWHLAWKPTTLPNRCSSSDEFDRSDPSTRSVSIPKPSVAPPGAENSATLQGRSLVPLLFGRSTTGPARLISSYRKAASSTRLSRWHPLCMPRLGSVRMSRRRKPSRHQPTGWGKRLFGSLLQPTRIPSFTRVTYAWFTHSEAERPSRSLQHDASSACAGSRPMASRLDPNLSLEYWMPFSTYMRAYIERERERIKFHVSGAAS